MPVPGRGSAWRLGGLLGGGVAGGRCGGDLPADASVALGAVDRAWDFGECSYVIGLGVSGPVRVHYTLSEPLGPTWLRLVEVGERRRRQVLGAALGCGLLADAPPPRSPGKAGRWLHVAGHGRTAWTDLPPDRRVGGVPVADLVAGLVPRKVWRELHVRRQEAWQEWARSASRAGGPDDAAGPGGAGGAGSAGGRRVPEQGEGWPGARSGGGRGAW
ncbi:hypothetical protein ACQEU6_39955 [Spirillospora sp. CA-108201]